MMIKKLSVFIVASLITTILWIFSKYQINVIFYNPLQSVGQISGLLGFTLLCLTIILTTKFIFLDRFFQGLDKLFRIHQIIGALAFILLLNHPLFLLANNLSNTNLIKQYILPSNDLAYTLGVVALYLLIISFIFIVFIKFPYHLWKLSHQILGLALLSGGLHSFLIISDISRFSPLHAWILLLYLLGLTSVIYSIFLYSRFGPRYQYTVTKIERVLDIINIYLTPSVKALHFLPGQFIYVSFKSKNLGVERHPFTISSSPDESILRVSVKILGDYTLNLSKLSENTKAIIYGPYGQFGKHLFDVEDSTQLWIAGGIGITPFLSFIHAKKQIPAKQIHFYHMFGNPEEEVFTNEIEEIKKQFPNLNFYSWCTKDKGKASIDIFAPLIKDPQNTAVFLCGPIPMMESFKSQLTSFGILPEKIYMEKFTVDQLE